MDVVDLLEEFRITDDVAIVTAAGLPEARDAVRVGDRFKDAIRAEFTPSLDDFLCKAGFECRKDSLDSQGSMMRTQEQMNMVGHDDVGVEMEIHRLTDLRKAISESVTDFRMPQQRQALIAGEGQETGVVGMFEAVKLATL